MNVMPGTSCLTCMGTDSSTYTMSKKTRVIYILDKLMRENVISIYNKETSLFFDDDAYETMNVTMNDVVILYMGTGMGGDLDYNSIWMIVPKRLGICASCRSIMAVYLRSKYPDNNYGDGDLVPDVPY